MALRQLTMEDGSWEKFTLQWDAECKAFEETLRSYLAGTIEILENLVLHPERKAGVYAFEKDGRYLSVCQLNTTPLPGYEGPVLRARFLTVSPEIDLGETTLETYSDAIVGAFGGVLGESHAEPLRADHIKFHLRSPQDQAFFAAWGSGLADAGIFRSVNVKGAWLYISKRQ